MIKQNKEHAENIDKMNKDYQIAMEKFLMRINKQQEQFSENFNQKHVPKRKRQRKEDSKVIDELEINENNNVDEKSMNKFDAQLAFSLQPHSINSSAKNSKSRIEDFGVISESIPKPSKSKRGSKKSGKVNSVSVNQNQSKVKKAKNQKAKVESDKSERSSKILH